jgi:hypothetical protein
VADPASEHVVVPALIAPENEPTDTGVKVTVTVVPWLPAGMLVGETEYGSAVEIVAASVPVFATVTVIFTVVPTVRVPKLRLVGLNVIAMAPLPAGYPQRASCVHGTVRSERSGRLAA